MKEKFRTAMLSCGEIDDDGDYYGGEGDSSVSEHCEMDQVDS
jgi:hypothetical protein